MTTQHTPGPWKLDPHEHANVIWADNGVICDVFHANEDDDMTACVESPQESEANAKLIAAAPELLAALQSLIASSLAVSDLRHNDHHIDDEDWSSLYNDVMDARSAIAKATASDL